MRMVTPNTDDSRFYNLTIEDKNGESDMFVTRYIPTENWLNDTNKKFEGNITTMRGAYLMDDDTQGGGDGGNGNNYSEPSPYYPTDCDGWVVTTIEEVAYQCDGDDHWPGDNECNCGLPGYSCLPAGYYQVPFYTCETFNTSDTGNSSDTGNPSDNTVGGGTSGDNQGTDNNSIGVFLGPDDDCDLEPDEAALDVNSNCEVTDFEECLANLDNFYSLNQSNQDRIEIFINENQCNDETSAFANLAIEALDNDGVDDGEVDFEDKIINKLTGKAKCVYDKLKGSDLMNKTIERFDGDKSYVNLLIKYGIPRTSGASGETTYGTPIEIVLRKTHIDNRPSLFTALVILHEGIHADLYRKVFITGGMTFTLPDIFTINGTRADFPTLFDYYNDYPDNPHHGFMADYYRNAIEQGLKDYANENGLSYPDQLYKDLAWAGLHNTNSWNNMFADPIFTASEQQRIITAINNFNNSGTNECL